LAFELRFGDPRLRRSSELFIEITRFIWDANPSYDVYQEFMRELGRQTCLSAKAKTMTMSVPRLGRILMVDHRHRSNGSNSSEGVLAFTGPGAA
jgi:hypothetical protein